MYQVCTIRLESFTVTMKQRNRLEIFWLNVGERATLAANNKHLQLDENCIVWYVSSKIRQSINVIKKKKEISDIKIQLEQIKVQK